METYQDYIHEIEERKAQGLHPKPIDGAELLSEIVDQIKDTGKMPGDHTACSSFAIKGLYLLEIGSGSGSSFR